MKININYYFNDTTGQRQIEFLRSDNGPILGYLVGKVLVDIDMQQYRELTIMLAAEAESFISQEVASFLEAKETIFFGKTVKTR